MVTLLVVTAEQTSRVLHIGSVPQAAALNCCRRAFYKEARKTGGPDISSSPVVKGTYCQVSPNRCPYSCSADSALSQFVPL